MAASIKRAKHDPIWCAVYAAAFVHHVEDQRDRLGYSDETIDRAAEEAAALADWDLERWEQRGRDADPA